MIQKFKDITGVRFGKLIAISRQSKKINNRSRTFWTCKCDCGKIKIIDLDHLQSGHTKSCGCESSKHRLKYINITHGDSKSKEFKAWRAIKSRCSNKKLKCYPHYGGRGIKVSDNWINSYSTFLSDMGRAPTANHSIERIDNNGDYDPSNCKWATKKEQANNTRSNTFITYKGEILTMGQWAEKMGLSKSTLSNRINYYKWPIEKALTYPLRNDSRRTGLIRDYK
ncbi:MAG TPA: hypothetical protein VGZ90_13690 [Puia sp.]|jgi:hypothetical protein|nr:hypothetical protein [Puia sp.]